MLPVPRSLGGDPVPKVRSADLTKGPLCPIRRLEHLDRAINLHRTRLCRERYEHTARPAAAHLAMTGRQGIPLGLSRHCDCAAHALTAFLVQGSYLSLTTKVSKADPWRTRPFKPVHTRSVRPVYRLCTPGVRAVTGAFHHSAATLCAGSLI